MKMCRKNKSFRFIIHFAISIFIWIVIYSCDKKEEPAIFEKPKLEILSIKAVSKDSCEIIIKTDKGVGANLQEANLNFEDITDTTLCFQKAIKISPERISKDTILVKTQTPNHDYRVTLIIKSQKNVFKSDPQIIHLSENYNAINPGISYISLYIFEDEYFYNDPDYGIGKSVNKGKGFMYIIHYIKEPNSTSQAIVKLNGNIQLKNDINFSSWSRTANNNDYVTVSGFAIIPEDLPAGDYSVNIYIDGIEYIASSGLRVLPGKSTFLTAPNPKDIGEYCIILYTAFKAGSKLSYFYYCPTIFIMNYDIGKNTWESKYNTTLPPGYSSYPSVLSNNFAYNNKNYILTRAASPNNASISVITIWEYDAPNNAWKVFTQYPGQGLNELITFVIGNKLYMGEGYINGIIDRKYDFWEYDFDNKTWTRKKDIPNTMHGWITAHCNSENEGFVFTYYRDLYKYNPLSDTWYPLTTLNGGPYSRNKTCLLYNKGMLYLIAGHTYDYNGYDLRDIWKYNISTDKWCLFHITDNYMYDAPAFIYNDKIYYGFTRDVNSSDKNARFTIIDL